MLVELFVILQVIALILWFVAFYTKQEVIWAISAVLLGLLMYSSFHVEILVPIYNATSNIYVYTVQVFRYPYISYVNVMFFGLCLLFGMFDLFDKYGINLLKKKNF